MRRYLGILLKIRRECNKELVEQWVLEGEGICLSEITMVDGQKKKKKKKMFQMRVRMCMWEHMEWPWIGQWKLQVKMEMRGQRLMRDQKVAQLLIDWVRIHETWQAKTWTEL